MLLSHLVSESLLLEGEPDGGSNSSDPPPTADPAEGQQPVSDPASEAAEGASDKPAPEGELPPAGEDATPPAVTLTAEDFQELIAAHPEQFEEAIKKAAVPAAEAPVPTALQPRRNPVREMAADNGRQAWDRIDEATKAINAGEEVPATLMADMYLFGSWTNAEAEGRQLDLAEQLLERTMGIDPANLDLNAPLQARYADALAKREQAHVNAGREFNKVYRETDKDKRSAILLRAEQQQATATAAFLLERDALLIEHGKKLGSAEKEKEAGKRIDKVAETAGKNGRTEALAKAQEFALARRATATAAQGGKNATRHTWAEIQKMTPAQIEALPQGEWERAMNEG